MSEDIKPKSVKIEIEIHEDGQLSIKSPILGDTMMMLGILEMCKATVLQFKANQTNIIKPRGGIMNFIKGGKRF